MISIFDFTDYKEYLKKFYQVKKEENPRFSYQLLAQKAGISNRGYIYNVINQKSKTFNAAYCYNMSKALGHNKKEAEYFENIVQYANLLQLKNEAAAFPYLKKALDIASTSNINTQTLKKYQFEYLSQWYHSAIRSLLDFFPISNNYDDVSKQLLATVTPHQIKKSLELMERLELIKMDENGYYQPTDRRIIASKEVSQAARNQYHTECIELARKCICDQPVSSRHALSITMSISAETYNHIINDTREFVEKIIGRIKNDRNRDRVYQYELLLFPLSKEQSPEKMMD